MVLKLVDKRATSSLPLTVMRRSRSWVLAMSSAVSAKFSIGLLTRPAKSQPITADTMTAKAANNGNHVRMPLRASIKI